MNTISISAREGGRESERIPREGGREGEDLDKRGCAVAPRYYPQTSL